MAKGRKNPDDVVIIKKYANRRLYNTAVAEFVTLDDLHTMVNDGTHFAVKDAKSDTDITTSILAQIIAEEESKGHNLLPLNYLRQLLSFYNDGVGQYLSTYLEQSMDNFSNNQQHIMQEMFGGAGAMQQFNEIGRRNLEILQQSMAMFSNSNSGSTANGNGQHSSGNGKEPSTSEDEDRQSEINRLQTQLAEIQQRLDDISSGS